MIHCNKSDRVRLCQQGRVVRTSFCPCKLRVSCFFEMGTDSCFFRFGAIDIYGPKAGQNSGPHQFLHSHISLRNNFADSICSTALKRCSVNTSFQTNLVLSLLFVQHVSKHYPCKRLNLCDPYHFMDGSAHEFSAVPTGFINFVCFSFVENKITIKREKKAAFRYLLYIQLTHHR